MRYLGEKCPFCKTDFIDESDIVVCPICGTPHHRECWNELGNCFNKELHKSGFVYTPLNSETDKRADEQVNLQIENGGLHIKTDESLENSGQVFSPYLNSSSEPITLQTDIGGITGEEYASFLGTSARRYMPRFLFLHKTGKKMMTNLFAFLLPFTFAAYKRMYRLAAILLAVNIFFIGIGIYGSLQKEPVKAVFIMFNRAALDGEITQSEMEQIKDAVDELTQIELGTNWTDYVVRYKLAVNIFTGLFATYLYMKESERKIKGLKANDIPKEMYNALLSKLGKGTLALPILGYIAIFLAAMVILKFSI
ncbi:MAG TPA: RING finger protein [Clostridia bacterium]|nr:RING finger protein [Clostridia bacterium]